MCDVRQERTEVELVRKNSGGSLHIHLSTKTQCVFLYLLRLPPALQDEAVGVYVLHADPGGQRQGGVRPHPVHHCPELRQEGNQTEPVHTHFISEQTLVPNCGSLFQSVSLFVVFVATDSVLVGAGLTPGTGRG